MEPTKVEDDESLYRAIRAGSDYSVRREGVLHFSTVCFNDPEQKPSVDRSTFREDPRDVRREKSDGVAKLITGEVRSICTIRIAPNDKNGNATYAVDAVHRPITEQPDVPENLAHCQIECAPQITPTHMKKLKDALARIAARHGFVVEPGSD